MNNKFKNWLKAAGIRGIKTFAQSFVSMVGVGMAIQEVDWLQALSVSAVALLLSLMTSIAGLPELKKTNEREVEEIAE